MRALRTLAVGIALVGVAAPGRSGATPGDQEYARLRDAIDAVDPALTRALRACTGELPAGQVVSTGYTLTGTGGVAEVTVSHAPAQRCVERALKGLAVDYRGPRARVEVPFQRVTPLEAGEVRLRALRDRLRPGEHALSLVLENRSGRALEYRVVGGEPWIHVRIAGEGEPAVPPPGPREQLEPLPPRGAVVLADRHAKEPRGPSPWRFVRPGSYQLGVEVWATDVGRVQLGGHTHRFCLRRHHGVVWSGRIVVGEREGSGS
jgi:hypothetical protein